MSLSMSLLASPHSPVLASNPPLSAPISASSPFRDILEYFESADISPEFSLPPASLLSLLRSRKSAFFSPHTHYRPRSSSSLSSVRSGSIKLHGETHTLHSDWVSLIEQFSAAVDLDELQSAEVLFHYLSSSSGSASLASSASFQPRAFISNAPNSPFWKLFDFYCFERSAQLASIASLLRISYQNPHGLHSVAQELTSEWTKEGWEKQLLDAYKVATQWKAANSGSASASSSSVSVSISTRLADQNVLEQALILEILFLLYYESDTADSLSVQQARIERTLELFYHQRFGTIQQNYTLLSERGRSIMEWIGRLCVLICIELCQFSALTKMFEPLDRVAELENENAEKSRLASLVVQSAVEEFQRHPLSSAQLIKKLDRQYFAPTEWPLDLPLGLHGSLLLSWATIVSRLLEFDNTLKEIRERFSLQHGHSVAQAAEIDENVILRRLESALSVSPFEQLLAILVDHPSGILARDSADPNMPAYKEVVNELLNALFQSSLYNAISVTPQHSRLFPLFCSIFENDAELCFRFWESEERNPELRPPLFDDAIAKFPIDIAPLLDLLAALAGMGAKKLEKLDASMVAEDGNGSLSLSMELSASDARACAFKCFRVLSQLSFFTSFPPPASIFRSLNASSLASPDSPWDVQLLSDWRPSGGPLIPRQTVGRHLPGQGFVQWALKYSAWPLIIRRLDSAVRSPRIGQQLSSTEWMEIHSIVRLIRKMITNDEALFNLVQKEINEDNESGMKTPMKRGAADSVVLYGSTEADERSGHPLSLIASAFHLLLFLASRSKDLGVDSDRSRFAMMDDEADGAAPSVPLAVIASILDHTVGILSVAVRRDPSQWVRDFLFIFGVDGSASGACQQYLQLVHALHSNLESVQGEYPTVAGMIEFLLCIQPIHQIAAIQAARVALSQHLKSRSATGFASPSSFSSSTALSLSFSHSSGLPTVPITSSMLDFAEFDFHSLIYYLLQNVLTGSSSWRFRKRCDRWRIGADILQLTTAALKSPVPAQNGRLALPQSVAHLFINENSVFQSILQPILLGSTLLSELEHFHRKAEFEYLHEFIQSAFEAILQLLKMEKTSPAPNPGSGPLVSFQQNLLESFSSSLWSGYRTFSSDFLAASDDSAGSADQFKSRSFVHALVYYSAQSRFPELQLLAFRCLTELCSRSPIQLNSGAAHNLSANLGSAANSLRRSLTAALSSSSPALVEQSALFLCQVFEHQSALAERFLRLSGPDSDDSEAQEEKGSHGLSGLITPLKSLLTRADSLFSSSPSLLLSVFSIIFNVWDSPAFSSVVQVLKSEIPRFWSLVSAPLGESVSDLEFASARPSQVRRFGHQLLIRSLALQILSAEIYLSTDCLDPELAAVLKKFRSEGKFSQWLKEFTRSHENPALNRELIESAKKLSMELAFFMSPVELSHENGSGSTSFQTFNESLAERVLHESLDDPNSRPLAESFLEKLREVNGCLFLSDCELILLRSWRTFTQMALLKHPPSIGIESRSPIASKFLHELAEILATKPGADGESGVMAILACQELNAIFLYFVNHFLGSDSINGSAKELSSSVISEQAKKKPVRGPAQQVKTVYQFACKIFSLLMTAIKNNFKAFAAHHGANHVKDGASVAEFHYSSLLHRLTADNIVLAPSGLSIAQSTLASALLLVRWTQQLINFLMLLTHERPMESPNDDLPPLKPLESGGKKKTVSFDPDSKPADDRHEFKYNQAEREKASDTGQGIEFAALCLDFIPIVCEGLHEKSLRNSIVAVLPLALQSIETLSSYRKHSDITIQKAVTLLRPHIAILLDTFASVNRSQASFARRLLQFFCVLSQSQAGALLLHEHSVVTFLCNHSVLSSDNHRTAQRQQQHIAPYEKGARSLWHSVWCSALDLVTSLVTQLASLPQSNFIGSAVEFLQVYRSRVLQALSLESACDQLTIAGLEEVEQLTALISALARAVSRSRAPPVHIFDSYRPSIFQLSDVFMKLLNDPRALEDRAMPVSKEEKAMFSGEEENSDKPGMQEKKTENEAKKEENKEEKENDKKSAKKAWRPLGQGSALSALLATPPSRGSSGTGLMSPIQTLKQAKSNIDEELKAAGSSFLLRAPVLNNMLKKSASIELNEAAESIFDSLPSQPAAAQESSPAFFTQRIEFCICSTLQHCLAFIRVETQILFEHPVPAHYPAPVPLATDPMFNYRIKIIDLGSNFVGSRSSASILDHTEASHTASENEYEELISSDSQYDYYGVGDVLNKRDRISAAANPTAAAQNFRPALSVLLDFCFYCIRVLVRLDEVESQGGAMTADELLAGESLPMPMPNRPPLLKSLPSIARAAQLSGPQRELLVDQYFQSSQASLSAPNFHSIRKLMTFLLENGIFCLLQHSQLHSENLLALHEEYSHSSAASQWLAAPALPGGLNATQIAQFPPENAAAAAANRIQKVLATYSERLGALTDCVRRYPKTFDPASDGGSFLTHICDRISKIVQTIQNKIGDQQHDPRAAHSANAQSDKFWL